MDDLRCFFVALVVWTAVMPTPRTYERTSFVTLFHAGVPNLTQIFDSKDFRCPYQMASLRLLNGC
jgi:hypothetical protein